MKESERLRNIERASAWNRANKERRTEIKRRSYQKNKEQVSESNRRWYEANREKMRIASAQWKKENATLVIEYSARRRARIKRNGFEKVTKDELDDLFNKQDGKCGYCKRAINDDTAHLDHVEPISRGGAHALYNLIWACQRCNLSKGSKTVDEWLGVA